MQRPTIGGQITFLYTHDLVGTSRFYEEVLCLPLKLDQGTCRIYRVSQDGYVGFCQRKETPGGADDPATRIILTLVTPDVDEWYRYLTAKGVDVEERPATNPKFQVYHFFLRDPNGYLLEIQSFLHPF
jgi:catechol 2,3-dioxygenase-like lactoylglutathione lyase family enzyme